MNIRQTDQKHWWNLWVDAETGEILAKVDWIANDTYEVFALPKESPHRRRRGRSRRIPADATASPFGWHDTDGVGRRRVHHHPRQQRLRPGGPRRQQLGLRHRGPARRRRRPRLHRCGRAARPGDPAAEPVPGCGGRPTCSTGTTSCTTCSIGTASTRPAATSRRTTTAAAARASDSVNADAQDGSGTNNANFATPRPDGSRPPANADVRVDADQPTHRDGQLSGRDRRRLRRRFGADFGPSLDTGGITGATSSWSTTAAPRAPRAASALSRLHGTAASP